MFFNVMRYENIHKKNLKTTITTIMFVILKPNHTKMFNVYFSKESNCKTGWHSFKINV